MFCISAGFGWRGNLAPLEMGGWVGGEGAFRPRVSCRGIYFAWGVSGYRSMGSVALFTRQSSTRVIHLREVDAQWRLMAI